MGLTKGKDGEWVATANGLIYPEHPEMPLCYEVNIKYCQYKWTDNEYHILENSLPGGNTLLSPSCEPLPDKYQDLRWKIRKFNTHTKIIACLKRDRDCATHYGGTIAQAIFVLLYQIPPEYLPLFINDKEKEIAAIAQWRLQY